jgi:hypothetical protein
MMKIAGEAHTLGMRYEDYYELSERHNWKTTDLDWDTLKREQDAGKLDDFDRAALEGTAVIEHGVPHYGEVWTLVPELRNNWELWQFTTLWTGEEHRHSFALKKACDILGFTPKIQPDLDLVKTFPFARTQKASCPSNCYTTVPGMLTYTIIQELVTNKFYGLAAKKAGSPFLRRLFQLIGADEMRHHVFFREALGELAARTQERSTFNDRIFEAAMSFRMPHLVYDVQSNFFEDGGWSIGTLGKIAMKAQLARCFAFDAGLLARLMTAASSEIAKEGSRLPTPRVEA